MFKLNVKHDAVLPGLPHMNTFMNTVSECMQMIIFSGWWSMAQLAAQDYFTRLQASGISPFAHPELAAAFPSALGMGGVNAQTPSSGNSRQSGSDSKSNNKNRKDKKSSNNNSSIGNATNNKGGAHTSSASSSASSYKV